MSYLAATFASWNLMVFIIIIAMFGFGKLSKGIK